MSPPELPTSLEIIPVTSQQRLEQVRDLFREYESFLRIQHGECCAQAFAKELAELPGAYAPPDGRLLLALDHGQPIGCVALRAISAGICEMKRLYVRPKGRGVHAGRALATALLAEARQIGYTHLRLDTLPSMTQALRLYQSLGFSRIETYGPHNPEGAICFELPL